MSRRKYSGPARKSRPTTFKDGPGLSSFDIDPEHWKPSISDPATARLWRSEVPIVEQPRLPGLEIRIKKER